MVRRCRHVLCDVVLRVGYSPFFGIWLLLLLGDLRGFMVVGAQVRYYVGWVMW